MKLSAQSNTVTDIDGNVYKTVKIGSQLWMAENLRTTHYNDGTGIKYITNELIWDTLRSSAYTSYHSTDTRTYFETNKDSIRKYGLQYNWYTVDSKKLCPLGWHVPSDNDWDTLTYYLISKGYNYTGLTIGDSIAKALSDTCCWEVEGAFIGGPGNNRSLNNTSGFSAIPAGDFGYYAFGYIGYSTAFWSSNQYDSTNAGYRCIIQYSYGLAHSIDGFNKIYGFSIRCLLDVCDTMNLQFNSTKNIICLNDSVDLSIHVCGGTSPYLYSWSSGEKKDSILAHPTNNTMYYVTVSDVNGTTQTDSIFIIVKQPTTAIRTISICQGDSYTFFGTTYENAGTYSFHLTNAIGCDSLVTLVLKIVQPSSSTISQTVCNSFTYHGNTYNSSGTYIVHITNAVGCDSAVTFHLTINEPSTSITNALICKGTNYRFNGKVYFASGTYTEHFQNAVGCDSAAILELQSISLPNILFPKDSLFCDSTNLLISLKDTTAHYLWQDGTTLANFAITNSGNYSVTATNICGVVNDSIRVTVKKSPKIKLPSDTILCTGKQIAIDITSIGKNKYLWQDNATKPLYTIFNAGTYSVSVTDSNNCKASKTMVVHELAAPQFRFPNDSVVCDEIQLPIDVSCKECLYVWNNGNETSKYIIVSSGMYSITVSNDCGIVKDSVRITVKDCKSYLDVPTAFSPNGDGLNDVLYAEGRNIENFSFIIYDRWGQKIFESNNVTEGWDGSFKGKTLEAATFMYFISATATSDGKKIEKKGNVTLIR